MTVHIYIEGGGDDKDQHVRLRQAFSTLFEKAGFRGRMPRLIAGGGRGQTFDRFQTAMREAGSDKYPVLLVDSEDPIKANDMNPDSDDAWQHLAERDGWKRPEAAGADQAQLMVTCMETWIVADRSALRKVFGNCLKEGSLPPESRLEDRLRDDVQQALENATRDCGRHRMYRKGRRSFQIVAALDPGVLRKSLPHFRRLLESLDRRLPQA